jgi:hypothetical protein
MLLVIDRLVTHNVYWLSAECSMLSTFSLLIHLPQPASLGQQRHVVA